VSGSCRMPTVAKEEVKMNKENKSSSIGFNKAAVGARGRTPATDESTNSRRGNSPQADTPSRRCGLPQAHTPSHASLSSGYLEYVNNFYKKKN